MLQKTLLTLVAIFSLAVTLAKQPSNLGGALIKIDSVSHDFGKVSRKGNSLSHTFVATNIGTSPLVITEGSTTCSCIKVKHPKRPIAPNEKANIEVKYELERKEIGPFHKVIKIFSNSSDGGCQVLTIHGVSQDK